MSSLNKVMLMGRLGADPEIRRLNNGNPVATIRLATSDKWTDKNSGEKKERTEWHSVVVFDERLCKVVEQYLHKGDLVLLEGQLQTRKWQDKDGQDRYSTEVVLNEFRGDLTLMPNGERQGRPGPGGPDDYGQERSRDERGGSGKGNGRNAKDQASDIVRGGGGGFAGGSRDMPHDDIPF